MKIHFHPFSDLPFSSSLAKPIRLNKNLAIANVSKCKQVEEERNDSSLTGFSLDLDAKTEKYGKKSSYERKKFHKRC